MSLIRKCIEVLSLCTVAFSCATPYHRPISLFVFDLENNRLVNDKSESLNLSDPKLKNYTCLEIEDLKSLYMTTGGSYGQCMDTNSPLEGD